VSKKHWKARLFPLVKFIKNIDLYEVLKYNISNFKRKNEDNKNGRISKQK